MSFLHELRLLARKCGIEVMRYSPANSPAGRISQLLAHNKINVVLDVGANDGGYGKELRASGYKGDILSFEPLEDAHHNLCLLAASDSQWEIAPQMALGNNNGEIDINVAGNSTSSSILPMENTHKEAAPKSAYIGKQSVKVHKLDSISHSLISAENRVYLKIDTQGYESEVLSGAGNTLKFITGIQLELSLVPLYEGQVLYQDIIDELVGMGFLLQRIIPGFTNNRTGQMLQMDGIFFRTS